ncbi:MAG: HAD family hydrolase [Rubricoccaceae bacterium]|nr:HAD family hydrolase [Rubricoccaceae bacterium]
MSIRALLFDLDGTLVDTNDAHTDAWVEAFRRHGYAPDRSAVARAIGMGGDQLVAHVLDEAAEARDGDRLRDASSEAFEALARRRRFRLFPGVEDLLVEARRRGLRLAIATSASDDDLALTADRTGVDLREHVHVVTNASQVEESKPEPDVLQAALGRLDLAPEEAVFVGDTVHDAEAAARAGVPFVGVTTGVWSEEAFRDAGARAVYRDTAALLAALDEVLALAEA